MTRAVDSSGSPGAASPDGAAMPPAPLAASPATAPAPAAAAAGAPAERQPFTEAVNILLVDDRPENLLALEAILEPLGQRLVRATSGDEALRHLLARDFAAILLDVQMPGLNGFETARLIKARERSRHIPIIFLTAINKDEEHIFLGYEVGAVDYMSKPFQPDVLRSKVAVFVDLYRKQEQLKRQEQQLRDSERRQLQLQHRAELLESEARLAQIVGSAFDAIVTADGDGQVTLFNAAAEAMFGREAADVVGRPVDALFVEAMPGAELERVAGAAADAGPDVPRRGGGAATYTGRRADGETFPAEATVSRLDLNGAVTYTLIVRDVSEQRRTEEALRTQAASLASSTEKLTALNAELQRRQAELQHAMNARNRFYASMSHELRTPINAIIGYSTLLIDHIYGPLNDRQRQGLVRSHMAAKHLLELVNDVLDLSKIEAGKIELSLQPVSFPHLVEELFVTVRPMADEHGSELTLAGDCQTTVITDPRRVRQVILNLLSNAIKFGGGKPIEVRCEARDGGVMVAVTDHGPGIRAADLPRIFDEFVQLPSTNPALQGTGLGLPISQRLARLLGGDLLVESTPGEGSTFRLLLPASCDEAVEASPPPVAANGAGS